MLELAGQLPPCCAGSGDVSAPTVCDGQVLLDIQVPGRLGRSGSELMNSQLLLGNRIITDDDQEKIPNIHMLNFIHRKGARPGARVCVLVVMTLSVTG